MVRLPWDRRSAPDDKPAPPAEIEAVETEVVPQPLARVSPEVRDRREIPPDVKSPTFFQQRMDYETEILAAINQARQIYVQWGFTHKVDWRARYWLEETADELMVKISSQSDARPTLSERWAAQEFSISWTKKPMAQLEMILREAKGLGLTLRQARPAFKGLPPEKMGKMIDESRAIEAPETIGILQLAGLVAIAARKRTDFFAVIDTAAEADTAFGAGKSQLLVQLLDAAYMALGQSFDLRHDIVYATDRARFNKLLMDRTPLRPFGVDELDQFAFSRAAMTGESKDIVQQLKRTRKFGRPVIGASGSIWGLDVFLRDVKVTTRIRVEEWDPDRFRGRATVWRKGGFNEHPEDRWGRFLFPFEFNGLPKETFDKYVACALKAEEVGNFDKFLQGEPDFLNKTKGLSIDKTTASVDGEPVPAEVSGSMASVYAGMAETESETSSRMAK